MSLRRQTEFKNGATPEESKAMDDLVTRFRQLQRFVGWTADDEDRLETVHALLAPHLGEMVDDFYAAIVGNESTSAQQITCQPPRRRESTAPSA